MSPVGNNSHLRLWFGKLAGILYDVGEAVVDIVIGELVDVAGHVLLQFAQTLLIVGKHGETEGQISQVSVQTASTILLCKANNTDDKVKETFKTESSTWLF